METNGISLFDQQPEPKKSSRTPFLLGGLAALTLVGALGAGFVIGGRGGDGRTGSVEAATAHATPSVPVSPTAKPQAQIVNPQTGGQAPAGNAQPNGGGSASSSGGGQPASNSGDTSGAGDNPVPTNTPVPPAHTNTPVPPTHTPVPPTSTHTPVPPTNTPTAVPPTNTPTATATPPFVPCPWCPIIDPSIIIPLLDFTPPVFSAVTYVNCGWTHTVSFFVNESSEIWVTYDHNGSAEETMHGYGTGIGFNLGGGWIWDTYSNVELHAVDGSGNAATLYPLAELCF